MPSVLAIETATTSVGVAVACDDGRRARIEIGPSRRHTETLAAAIAFLAEHADLPLSSLDAIAVDVGPGLFTGLRVGVATASSLAFALGIGVVAVRSTDIVARGAGEPVDGRRCAVVLDARRRELYAAIPGEIDPFVAGPAEVLRRLRSATPLVLIGEGARSLAPLLEPADAERMVFGRSRPPDPLDLAEMALAGIDAAIDPAAVSPLYLRAPDAQITWETRYGAAADRTPDRFPDRLPS